MTAALFFALLGGCSSWIDGAPACNHDVYSWSDDLLAHILTGEGDGAFAYDPEDVPRKNIAGSYDVNTGDFSWDVTYASDYFLQSESVTGYGTAYHNGDLDLLFTDTVTDVLGNTGTTNYRTVRKGCSMTIAYWSNDNQSDLIVEDGSYADADAYNWEGVYGDYALRGGMRQNLSHTFGYEANDGSAAVFTTYKPEGTSDSTMSGEWDTRGRTYEGTTHGRFDGGTEGAYKVYDTDGSLYLTVTSDYAYDGSGGETQVDADGNRCDLSVTSGGDCSYTCDDGSSGGC